MTRTGSIVELDSYRLARYAESVPCFICDEGNTLDAELCRHCFAPMALGHQASNTKVPPQMVGCIGASGVGKTVYLGMLLDIISRQTGDDLQVLARGAFSLNLQQKTMTALARNEFPEKTPCEPDRWNWVHCQVNCQYCPRPFELIMPDIAGEALLEEVDHPKTYKVVQSFLKKCQGAAILIDAQTLSGGTAEHDYFTMKLLSYLLELDTNPKSGWRNRPLAIVFSKADQCDSCFDDPEEYARQHAAGLWRHCRERFNRHKFFAASVTGNCAFRETPYGPTLVPLRIEPRGIIAPFLWLITSMNKK